MKNLSYKIILIFLIPTFAVTYFSYYFVNMKYEHLQESLKYKRTAKITQVFSSFVHNIQIERGLSAGYLVTSDKTQIKHLLKEQHKKTDKAYKKIFKILKSDDSVKNTIIKEIGLYNKPLIKETLYLFSKIKKIRTQILARSISFEDEVDYYSKMNVNVLNGMDSLIIILKRQTKDNDALSKLHELKEYAGLERAYVYNLILSENNIYKEKIKQLQKFQELSEKEFMLNTSINSTLIYTHFLNLDTLKKVNLLREKIFNNTLSNTLASRWFKESSARIDIFEVISTEILNTYINNADKIYKQSLNSLYMAAIVWIMSTLSLVLLTYLLFKLIKSETSHIEELRIASYSFNSHEAIVITDVDGIIIKVNSGFSRITGYTKKEAIGKSTRLLNSGKHDKDFFENMWRQIHTLGQWSDEIYNKRKNGEIYLEKLSITAIKDDKDVTTHYVAHFLDISELKKAQELAEHQSDHDFLTGLPNRKQLMKRLQEERGKARRHDLTHAFLFIDLDNFKPVNDTHGHKVGDLLLQNVASELKNIVREEDLTSRISGDEFAILILNIDKNRAKANIEIICNKILKTLSDPFIINDINIKIGASIGIKIFPDGENNINDIIVKADTAMYHAKNQGKNQFSFFNADNL